MIFNIDKRLLNILVIIFLTCSSFSWTFWIFHLEIEWSVIAIVIAVRIASSVFIFQDFSLSWSKVTPKTFLLKSFVYGVAFCIYAPFYYTHLYLSFMFSELLLYLFAINFSMYFYYYLIHRTHAEKDKSLVIYGAGKAGLKLEEEYRNSTYAIKFFVDDDKNLQKRSIDGISIVSREKIKEIAGIHKYDLLVIAIPSAKHRRIKEIYEELSSQFYHIKILPSLDEILRNRDFSAQLKAISVEDLLARHPQDLDKIVISSFIENQVVMISGAGGSIGSEVARQCLKYGVKQLILLDHSEYNLYALSEELGSKKTILVMQSVLNEVSLDKTLELYKPDIFIHAAAYKHVPLVESNIEEGIINNVLGTKNCIDLAIKHSVEKFILISTDKAVRPTNVMGATKRICELYAQNVEAKNTHIVSVRFGNVLGSSGSVIPKFRAQIEKGGPLTVTHPDIKRYFMLIPEACELVLQTGAIGRNGELFILDMGEAVRIVDLAQKMIELSGKDDIKIEFTGLRAGEKLYEELLLDESDKKTQYASIMVAYKTDYDIEKLKWDIEELLTCKDKISQLKKIVPEFNHQG